MIILVAFALASVITFAAGLKLNDAFSSGISTILDLIIFAVTFYYAYKILNHLRNS